MNELIGVIDSGVGGLTVVQELKNSGKDILYIADGKYCPYGEKSARFIEERAESLCRFLVNNNADSIVLACNTASTKADKIQKKIPVPIYGVIKPTCRKVENVPNAKRVALLATEATVKSGVYRKELTARGYEVKSFNCGNWVSFVEKNQLNTLPIRVAVHAALNKLPSYKADVVILGCTHFPLLRNLIEPYCAGSVIVESCCDYSINRDSAKISAISYFTTGNAYEANAAAYAFEKVKFKHIEI